MRSRERGCSGPERRAPESVPGTAAALVVGLAVTGILACGDGPPGGEGVFRTDSAGVEIVFSPRPAWEDGRGWTLTPEPRLQIGAVEGDPSRLFSRISAVRGVGSGAIVVAEAEGNMVRWFGTDGRLLGTAGGTGEGPGEFTQLAKLFPAGRELWAFDGTGRPGAVFTGEGRRVGEVRVPIEIGRVDPVGVFADGSVLWSRYSDGRPVRSGVYEDSATLVRTRPKGRLDTVARLPEVRYVEYPGRPLPLWQTWGPRLWLEVRDRLLYAGYSEWFDVAVRQADGTVVRRIRRAGGPPPVAPDHVASELERMTTGVPDAALPQRRAMHEAMIFPERHPAHGELMADAAGHLWVRRLAAMEAPLPRWGVPEAATRWDVFDPSGAWLGLVTMPPLFRPEEIGEDAVAGVWMDPLDVEYVRVYGIVKSPNLATPAG